MLSAGCGSRWARPRRSGVIMSPTASLHSYKPTTSTEFASIVLNGISADLRK